MVVVGPGRTGTQNLEFQGWCWQQTLDLESGAASMAVLADPSGEDGGPGQSGRPEPTVASGGRTWTPVVDDLATAECHA